VLARFVWMDMPLMEGFSGELLMIDMDECRRIRLDVCSMCQLECPLCETPGRKKGGSVVGWGYVRFNDFRKLIEKNPNIKEINISWLGEIFLNPDLKSILEFSYERGIKLRAEGGVNLNDVTEDMLESLVMFRFHSITVSIDGASQKTYVKYRKNGNFNKVMRNIQILNGFKKKYNSESPQLSWQFIVFGHNEHEIPVAREMAAKLGMHFFTKASWDPHFSPVKDKEFIRRETGQDFVSRDEYSDKYDQDYMDQVCKQVWDEPVINWDGQLFGCCKNNRKSYGNVFKTRLKNALDGEEYRYMKDMLLGKKPPKDSIICTKCPVYLNRKGKNES